MQNGRKKAAASGRRRAVQRVLAFRKWLDEDLIYSRQFKHFLATGEKVTAKKPKPPATGVPSDNDYKVAREEGAIQ